MVGVIGGLDLVLSLALVGTLLAIIYRYMPARRLPWKGVLIGVHLPRYYLRLAGGVVGLYLAHSTQPSAFEAASSFAALLLWLYYTAQIFLFGAECTACLGGLRRQQRKSEAASNSALSRSCWAPTSACRKRFSGSPIDPRMNASGQRRFVKVVAFYNPCGSPNTWSRSLKHSRR